MENAYATHTSTKLHTHTLRDQNKLKFLSGPPHHDQSQVWLVIDILYGTNIELRYDRPKVSLVIQEIQPVQ